MKKTFGWLVLLGSLFGLFAPLAYEDYPGDGASLVNPVMSSGPMESGGSFFTLIDASQTRTCWPSPIKQLEEAMQRVEREIKGDVCPLLDVRAHLQALFDFSELFRPFLLDDSASASTPEPHTREWHVERQMHRISAGMYVGPPQLFMSSRFQTMLTLLPIYSDARLKGDPVVDDDHVILAAIRVLAAKLYLGQDILQRLSDSVNHLSESNRTLTGQLADIYTDLQKEYQSTSDLRNRYEGLERENAKYEGLERENQRLKMLIFPDSSLPKRGLDTNTAGSADSSNVSAPSNNLSFAERLAKLEAKPEDPDWKTVPAIVFTFIGYASAAHTFLLLIWDSWLPRLAWCISWIVGLCACCCSQNVKIIQDWLKKKFPTKTELKALVTTLRTDVTGIQTSHNALDTNFKEFTAAASQNQPAGPFVTLQTSHDALETSHNALDTDFKKFTATASQNQPAGPFVTLQTSHDALNTDFKKFTAVASQNQPAGPFVTLQTSHDALDTDFKKFTATASQNQPAGPFATLKADVAGLTTSPDGAISKLRHEVQEKTDRITKLEDQVSELTQRIAALEQAPAVQAPAGQTANP
ncbi:hypothetical protein N0V92_003957 [Colletotrichum tropicale]|nr:hypothetical protein N0V92_003957 [Colletotrichum tropicale]